MSRLNRIYSACPLVFDFQYNAVYIEIFLKFCILNLVVYLILLSALFGPLQVKSNIESTNTLLISSTESKENLIIFLHIHKTKTTLIGSIKSGWIF